MSNEKYENETEITSYKACYSCNHMKLERYTINLKKYGGVYYMCESKKIRCDKVKFCDIGEREKLKKKLKKIKNV